MPAIVRMGSPVRAIGLGLAGARLQFAAGQTTGELTIVEVLADGNQVAEAHLIGPGDRGDGVQVGSACLADVALAGWLVCVETSSVFMSTWRPGPAALALPAAGALWGNELVVRADDLLLPGEGDLWLDSLGGETMKSAAIITSFSGGRREGTVWVRPSWTGATPGARATAFRLRGEVAGKAQVGAWSAPVHWQLLAPTLTVTGQSMGRGRQLPMQSGVVESALELTWTGDWLWPSGAQVGWANDSPPRLRAEHDGAFVFRSNWLMTSGLPVAALFGAQFTGQLRLRAAVDGETWLGPPIGVAWQSGFTEQHVVLDFGAGWQAGVHRLGLGAARSAIESAVLAELRGLFANFAVVFHRDVAPPGETLRVGFADRDPNGLHLLGAEVSPQKDTGNWVLDEQLGGVNLSARRAGNAAYGGIFVGELLGFSAKLHPAAPLASHQFDSIFGAFCPELGGSPLAGPDTPGGPTAVRAFALAVAEVTAHEIGHALGLAAGTAEAHHVDDVPGRLMDAGQARPFAERAQLPGAVAPHWGATDSAYLQVVLPRLPK